MRRPYPAFRFCDSSAAAVAVTAAVDGISLTFAVAAPAPLASVIQPMLFVPAAPFGQNIPPA